MAAARHINPNQLAMLYQAKDLVNPEKFVHDSQPFYSSPEKMREMKLEEAKAGSADTVSKRREPGNPSLAESISREGVRVPVVARIGRNGRPTLSDGHHRVIAAADVNPNMEIPVRWWPADTDGFEWDDDPVTEDLIDLPMDYEEDD